MVKKPIFFIISLLCLLLIVGEYIGDIDNFILKGSGYRLTKNFKDHIALIYEKSGQVIIDQQVLDIKIRGDYLLVLRMKAESFECSIFGKPTIVTKYTNVYEYWIIKLKSHEVTGPFAKESFLKLIHQLNLQDASFNIPNTHYTNKTACDIGSNS